MLLVYHSMASWAQYKKVVGHLVTPCLPLSQMMNWFAVMNVNGSVNDWTREVDMLERVEPTAFTIYTAFF